MLRDEFPTPIGLSVYQLTQVLGTSCPWLNNVVLGCRGVTVDTAPCLGWYFGTTLECRVNLQARCDRDVSERAVRQEMEAEIEPHAA